MNVKILSADLFGVEAYPVEVEVDVGPGLPGYHLVGLAATAVSEGRVRIRAALRNTGFSLPARKITVNLAPAEIRKDTTAFDVPIALAVLAGLDLLPRDCLKGVMAVGELGLDGRVRPVRGALSVALTARRCGAKLLLVPEANGPEAALVEDLEVRTLPSLADAVAFLRGEATLAPAVQAARRRPSRPSPDLSDVRGQHGAKRALELAAAGGHNLLMVGPPGSGKSMLARRLATILPSLSKEEALDCTQIYSVAGLLDGSGLVQTRPFRAPHHTVSTAGLVGGGPQPRPGELSLAHNGVLFLDEILEFRRQTLEALRQPLEDKTITVTRAKASVRFPARITLVAAMNPCPCGYLGDPTRACVCSAGQVARYRARLSGPLLDRFDIQVRVPRLTFDELSQAPSSETSLQVRERVEAARRAQADRFADMGGLEVNADMAAADLGRFVGLDDAGRKLLARSVEQMGLSARAVHRMLKVARTAADLDGSAEVCAHHVAEAVSFRSLDWDAGFDGGREAKESIRPVWRTRTG